MTTADDFFAAGLEQVRKSWSWFLVLGISLIVLGVLCVGRPERDHAVDSSSGLDPCHQRSDVACQRISCPQLAWVLSVPN